MKTYNIRKGIRITSGGMCMCHKMHYGLGSPLLLDSGLGSTPLQGVQFGTGVSSSSEKIDIIQKIPINNLSRKLESLQIRNPMKRKNISFMI